MSEYQPQVALVTGASRGAGKGIALALGAAGMTVYVTGRSVTRSLGRLKDVALPGTIVETAAQITALGGTGIALSCDHRDDAAVESALARVAEESGALDILVNNAASIHDALIDPGGFWEKPLELADILDVGLRSAYVASYFAAPLMVRARRGLIAFVSSFGSSCYMHGPAYGAQKAGVDKFAADMAVDLAPWGITFVPQAPRARSHGRGLMSLAVVMTAIRGCKDSQPGAIASRGSRIPLITCSPNVGNLSASSAARSTTRPTIARGS
jgi:NAD(P)-dependent dehydrogenase (short-subunit alcohol dehydrogenase family)